MTILTLFITIIAFLFSLNEGIHFNYKKEKITIVQGSMIKVINMRNVKYFEIKEIFKVREIILFKKLLIL